MQIKKICRLSIAALLFLPSSALAQTQLNTGDTAWMLVACALVLLMTIPGLALFYCGMVRKKNVLAMVMQSFSSVCVVTVLWVVAGYSLTFTDGGAYNDFIGGLSKVSLNGMTTNSLVKTIPESVFMMFQLTFAIITVAIISGAIADRVKFSSFILFVILWTLLVYVPIAHWIWGGGFLSQRQVLDFAGGTVVHINSGIAGLVAAIMIGKRYNYGRERMEPNNLVFSVVGASFLWIGWFGFNAGSALAANGSAGMAMAVTQIAAASAALAWMFAECIVYRKAGVVGIISGSVAGLVAITPGAGFVDPFGALVIGLVAGLVCFIASTILKQALRYDDSFDVFGIHAVGGIIGVLLTGVFASEAIGGARGLLEGNPQQVWIQAHGIGMIMIWSGCLSLLILKLIDITIGLRVHPQVEIEGLDINLHGEFVR